MGSTGDDQIEYFSSSNSININPRKVNYIQSSGNIMKPIRLTNKNDFLGMIGFNIEYDFPTRNLIFSDIRGKNFKYIKKAKEVSSCFFKISLLENDEIKTDKCTELSEYMNNPVFSNALKFHLRTDQIGNAVFKFQYVLRKGKNEFFEKGNLALKFKNEFCNQIVNALLDKAPKNNYSWYEIKNLVDEDFDKLV